MVLGEPPGEDPTIPPHWEFPLINGEGLKVLQVREDDGWLAYQLKTAQGEGMYCEVFFNSNGKRVGDLSIIGEVASVGLLKGDTRIEINVDATNFESEDQFKVHVEILEPFVWPAGRIITPATTLITYGYNVDYDPYSNQKPRFIGIMDLVLLRREQWLFLHKTTSLSVNPVHGESADPKTYDLNQDEPMFTDEKRRRKEDFDVTWEGDANGLKVTEVNKKTGEVRIVECPTVIDLEKTYMTANAKSYIDPDTGKLVSLWRKLDEIIPVRLSGSRPLPPPKPKLTENSEVEI